MRVDLGFYIVWVCVVYTEASSSHTYVCFMVLCRADFIGNQHGSSTYENTESFSAIL